MLRLISRKASKLKLTPHHHHHHYSQLTYSHLQDFRSILNRSNAIITSHPGQVSTSQITTTIHPFIKSSKLIISLSLSLALTDDPDRVPSSDLDGFNHDWMGKYKGQSKLVLKPKSTHEVSQLVAYCVQVSFPLILRSTSSCLLRFDGCSIESIGYLSSRW